MAQLLSKRSSFSSSLSFPQAASYLSKSWKKKLSSSRPVSFCQNWLDMANKFKSYWWTREWLKKHQTLFQTEASSVPCCLQSWYKTIHTVLTAGPTLLLRPPLGHGVSLVWGVIPNASSDQAANASPHKICPNCWFSQHRGSATLILHVPLPHGQSESCRFASLQTSSALGCLVPVVSAPNWKEQPQVRRICLHYFVTFAVKAWKIRFLPATSLL